MLRSIIAVAVGIVVGVVLIMLGHFLSLLIYPMPADLDWNDHAAVAAHLETLPAGAWCLVVLAHGLGPLGGGFVAAWIGRRARMILALIVGVFFLVGGLMNLFEYRPAVWVWVVDILVYLPAAYVGFLLAPRGRTNATSPPSPGTTEGSLRR
jgi:hypothetical protein